MLLRRFSLCCVADSLTAGVFGMNHTGSAGLATVATVSSVDRRVSGHCACGSGSSSGD